MISRYFPLEKENRVAYKKKKTRPARIYIYRKCRIIFFPLDVSESAAASPFVGEYNTRPYCKQVAWCMNNRHRTFDKYLLFNYRTRTVITGNLGLYNGNISLREPLVQLVYALYEIQ